MSKFKQRMSKKYHDHTTKSTAHNLTLAPVNSIKGLPSLDHSTRLHYNIDAITSLVPVNISIPMNGERSLKTLATHDQRSNQNKL